MYHILSNGAVVVCTLDSPVTNGVPIEGRRRGMKEGEEDEIYAMRGRAIERTRSGIDLFSRSLSPTFAFSTEPRWYPGRLHLKFIASRALLTILHARGKKTIKGNECVRVIARILEFVFSYRKPLTDIELADLFSWLNDVFLFELTRGILAIYT